MLMWEADCIALNFSFVKITCMAGIACVCCKIVHEPKRDINIKQLF